MSFEITYKPLIGVDILHHFLLDSGLSNFEGLGHGEKDTKLSNYRVDDLLSIVPTTDTKKKLSDFRIIFKQNNWGFKLLSLKDGSADIPLVVPDAKESLCFLVTAKDSSFFHVTNINFDPEKILFYHNYSQPSDHYPNISAVPAAFDASLASDMASDGNPDTFAYQQGDMLVDDPANPARIYLARQATIEAPGHSDWEEVYPTREYSHGTHYNEGDMVWYDDGGNEGIYEAIQDNHNNQPNDTSNWSKIGDLPILYSSQNDLYHVKYHQLSYSFTEFGQELSITVENIKGNIIYETSFKPVDSVPELVISADKLQEGLLRVQVKDESDTIVLNDEFVFIKHKTSGKIAALIQLDPDAVVSEYQLLNPDETFKGSTFRIRFKNRKTNWRYYNKAGQSLLETEPNPLVSSGYIKIQIDGKDVPNPGFTQILPTVEKIYSDVYLNT
jgi:hypothetical protein